MNKVTLPAMPLAQAEAIRKIAQRFGSLVTYIVPKEDCKQVIVEIETKAEVK